MKKVTFTVEQVIALCGGKFPHAKGFAWERVGHFLLENGVLQPYAGTEILPGPGLTFMLQGHSRYNDRREFVEID